MTQAQAQILDSLKVHAVEWTFPGTRGDIQRQEFQQLRSDFNFGEYLSVPSASYDWTGQFRSSTMSFAFKVVSQKQSLKGHSALLILRKQVINLDWYNGNRDTLTIDLSGRYEYFQLGLGYDYRSIDTRLIKLLSGVSLEAGLPVSGFQTETEALESKFFSDSSVTLTATFNLILEIRLFKKTYFKFGPSWAIGYYNFDGFRTWIPQSGLVSGFKFGL